MAEWKCDQFSIIGFHWTLFSQDEFALMDFYTYQIIIIKKQSMWKILRILAILLAVLTYAKAQVLGIDFGTEFWKAALISPGRNLVIVENSRSERKTLNSIAFQEGERFFEEDSKAKRLRKPHLSYFYLNRLIRSLDTKEAVEGYNFVGETYAFEDGDKEMSLEQVVGMILKNIKEHASKQAGTEIKDVVLTVPAHWGFNAKMSLVNAAYLADLSVLGLINENSAAAIQYAITRNDTDPFNVMFFNLGSHNLQISIFKMFGYLDESKNKTIESVEALSHVVAENVGGLSFDHQIASYLATEFQKKHKVDPVTNKKSFTKLVVKSSEVKETLSANKETHVYIEGLIDGIDLALPIKRNVIEDSDTFASFTAKIDEALEKAQLTKADLHAIEMIGGASRIPKIMTILKSYFPDTEVGAHINGDEAMAFGSALRAANLSLTFKVKQVYFYDAMNLDTKVVISNTDQGVITEETLFHITDHHGAKKSLSIPQNSDDIKITVYVGDEIVKEFVSQNLGNWKTKYENQNFTAEPNTVIDFMMSSVHIAEIKEFYVNITLNITEVKEKVEYVDEEVEVEEKKEEKEEKEEKQEKEDDSGQVQEEKTEETETKDENAGTEKAEQKEEATQEEKKDETEQEKPKKKTKKITKTIKKQVEEHRIEKKKYPVSHEEVFTKYKRFTKTETAEKKKLLQGYEAFEKQLREKAKIRNDFESALYSLKDDFDRDYLKMFGKEEEVTELKEIVTTEIEWMDENAWTASKNDFEDHFKTLTSVYEPIYNRTVEYQNREKAYNESLQYFGAVYQKTNELIKSHPWISQQINEHLIKINETVMELNTRLKQQASRPLNENPIIYNSELASKAERLRDEYYLLRLIKKPKNEDKKEQKPKEEAKAEETEEESADTEEQSDDVDPQNNEEGESGDTEDSKEDL